MERKLLMSCLGSAIALCLCVSGAAAAPGHFGLAEQHAPQGNLVIPARFMGGGMGGMGHMGGMGGMGGMGHIGGMGHMGHMGHIGHMGPVGHMGRFHAHDSGHHHHRHNRFFFVGAPYYDDYYYNDYSDDCWWSRRYHRWICSDY